MNDLYEALEACGVTMWVADGAIRVSDRKKLTGAARRLLWRYQASIIEEWEQPLANHVHALFGGKVTNERGREIQLTDPRHQKELF